MSRRWMSTKGQKAYVMAMRAQITKEKVALLSSTSSATRNGSGEDGDGDGDSFA
jgi:single-stranded DNA-binding protein